MKTLQLTFALLAVCATSLPAADRILVYTHNGKGYVHQNIATSIKAIQEIGKENKFEVDSSDDPAVFTTANLKQYKAIVFSNSNNEAFDTQAQRDAFQAYVHGGGGIVGIHSATGSERNWPYFQAVMGGKFVRHPKLQKFTVRVKDPKHPATKGAPATFEWEDECYYTENLNPDLKVLLVTDPTKLDDPKRATEYPGDKFGDSVPLSWYHEYDGGREYYIALGHKDEHYSMPVFRQQLRGGILWAMGREKMGK